VKRVQLIPVYVLCLSALMVVLDSTVVNVALPTIKQHLGFSNSSLAWVVNAYLLTFGGFLILGGRLGDVFGHRRVLVMGIILFTIASLLCGVSFWPIMLVVARAVQGLGVALISALSLSLIIELCRTTHERSQALGVYAFVSSGGSAVGVLLGGLIVGLVDWHWIFLVNVPVGVGVVWAILRFVPKDTLAEKRHLSLDVLGAVLVTSISLCIVYTILHAGQVGWRSAQSLYSYIIVALLSLSFVVVEKQAKTPILPLSLLKAPGLLVSNFLTFIWSGAMLAWFFIMALYLQFVLHYRPLNVGLSFLAQSLAMAVVSLRLSAWSIRKLGSIITIALGSLLVSVGLLLSAHLSMSAPYVSHILPVMILMGFGAGLAMNPLILVTTSKVPSQSSGLASGLVNTSLMLGGAIGLTSLSAVAAAITSQLGTTSPPILLVGYHVAFVVGAVSVLVVTFISLLWKIFERP